MTSETERSIPALDGVRALACLLVVFCHTGLAGWFSFNYETGQLGVMLFFALSGFLMAYHYMPGQLSARYWLVFLIRRLFRVYPAFMAVTFFLWISATFNLMPWLQPQFNSQMMLGHWLLQQGEFVYWTIPIEIKFYFCFPLLAVSLLALRLPPWMKWVELIILAALWVLIWQLGKEQNHNSGQLFLFPYLILFLGGVIAGRLYTLTGSLKSWLWDIIACGCLGILLLLCVPDLAGDHISNIREFVGWQHIGFISILMMLTVWSIAQSMAIVKHAFSNPPVRCIGEISYSMYLVHELIAKAFLHIPNYSESLFDYFGTIHMMAISLILVPAMMYIFIEKPFNKLGKIVGHWVNDVHAEDFLTKLRSKLVMQHVERYQT